MEKMTKLKILNEKRKININNNNNNNDNNSSSNNNNNNE